MRRAFFVLGVLWFLAGCGPSEIQLFNGKDLSNWTSDVPESDTVAELPPSFVVRDGLLISMGEPRGHLITKEDFENYRLTLSYRFPTEPGNCGVLVHASTPRFLYKMFPKSIEVQLEHQNAGDFWVIGEDISVPDMEARRGPKEHWGTTEGKARRITHLQNQLENPLGQWNTLVVESVEDEIKVWVNGILANHGFEATATKGKIALQAEGAIVEFREITLQPISRITD